MNSSWTNNKSKKEEGLDTRTIVNQEDSYIYGQIYACFSV